MWQVAIGSVQLHPIKTNLAGGSGSTAKCGNGVFHFSQGHGP